MGNFHHRHQYVIEVKNADTLVIACDEVKGAILMELFASFIKKSEAQIETNPPQNEYTFPSNKLDEVINCLQQHGHSAIAPCKGDMD